MEPRIITIVSTTTQRKSTITSSATTLRELKEDLRKANIGYDGMAFYEGLSKTELKSDDSLLPKDIEYKGQVTNNLVFMLTKPMNKIKSGLDRKEAFNYIKKYNLQKEFQTKYNKSFTNSKTTELEEFITKHQNAASILVKEEVEKIVPEKLKNVEKKWNCTEKLKQSFDCLLQYLYENECLSDEQYDNIQDILNEGENKEKPKKSSIYNQSEIDDMFKGMM